MPPAVPWPRPLAAARTQRHRTTTPMRITMTGAVNTARRVTRTHSRATTTLLRQRTTDRASTRRVWVAPIQRLAITTPRRFTTTDRVNTPVAKPTVAQMPTPATTIPKPQPTMVRVNTRLVLAAPIPMRPTTIQKLRWTTVLVNSPGA